MEEDSKERAPSTPQLLNLIRDGREWKAREAVDGGRSRSTGPDDADDKKLELKLGLPGVQEDERIAGQGEKIQQEQESYTTALSLGCFPSQSKLPANNATTGAKRGFLATVNVKPEGCKQSQRHQERVVRGNELTFGGENMAGERKKGCCPPSSSHDSAAGPVQRSNPQARGSVLPVVGWPPVRSLRRNLTNGCSSKESSERQNDEAGEMAKLTCKMSVLVKINMDGIPIGRKIDLAAYDSYQKMSYAVQELFRGFVEVQKDITRNATEEQGANVKIFSGLLGGTGEYTLVHEDNGGGRTLVGDLPWNVFVSTAKRLKVMRTSEVPHGLIKTSSGRVAGD